MCTDIVLPIHQPTTADTEITEIDLFKALNNLYDNLLAVQHGLDEEAEKILYENLWELMGEYHYK
ncbi:MAG: hypothetical protein ABFS56_18210 [Pseudomonadota bacterium]